MRFKLQFVLLLALSPVALAGELVDRVIAVVQKRVVLQSEWDDTVRLERLMEGRAGAEAAPAERQQALDHLLEQVLLQTEIAQSNVVPPTPQEITARLEDVRDDLERLTRKPWSTQLRLAGLDEDDVRDYLRAQIETLRFVDARFRPNVRVDNVDIEKYYRETYLPELRRRGATLVPLNDVRDKIESILVQQRIDDLFEHWLQTARGMVEMRIAMPEPPLQTRPEVSK